MEFSMQDKEFYELVEKMFNHMNPPGTPELKPYFPKREWVGLTAQEAADCWTTSASKTWHNLESALKEKNT